MEARVLVAEDDLDRSLDSVKMPKIGREKAIQFTDPQWARVAAKVDSTTKSGTWEQLHEDGVYPYSFSKFTKDLDEYLERIGQ